MNIYVANVPYSVKDQDFRELFEPFGEVTSAKIIMDKATNRSRGFGFVEMSDDAAARQAIEGTNGKSFHGRDLVVNEARPRPEGDRPFRGGGDRGGFRNDRGGFRERERGDRFRRDEESVTRRTRTIKGPASAGSFLFRPDLCAPAPPAIEPFQFPSVEHPHDLPPMPRTPPPSAGDRSAAGRHAGQRATRPGPTAARRCAPAHRQGVRQGARCLHRQARRLCHGGLSPGPEGQPDHRLDHPPQR